MVSTLDPLARSGTRSTHHRLGVHTMQAQGLAHASMAAITGFGCLAPVASSAAESCCRSRGSTAPMSVAAHLAGTKRGRGAAQPVLPLPLNELLTMHARDPARAAQFIGVPAWYRSSGLDDITKEPWGIHGVCFNVGPVVNRKSARSTGESGTSESLQPFYASRLWGAAPPPPAAHPAVSAAEAELGITATADVALVVDVGHLADLRRVFPNLRIRRFEDVRAFWSVDAGDALRRICYSKYPDLCTRVNLVSLSHTRYSVIVNTTGDAELWAPDSTPIIGGADSTLTVDVLVRAHPYDEVAQCIVKCLAERAWVGRTGIYDFVHPGARSAAPELGKPVEVVIMPSRDLTPHFHTHLVPLHPNSWSRAAHCDTTAARARWVLDSLESVDCGWFDAAVEPVVRVLQPPEPCSSESEVADLPGLSPEVAVKLVTPVSPATVSAWLDKGAVADGTVALVDARHNDVATLKDEHWRNLYCTSSNNKHFEELALATLGASDIIFFCNHASSVSPRRAVDFVAWQSQQKPVEGIALPRVRLLVDGMRGLVNHTAELGKDRMRERFQHVYEGSCQL